MKSVVRSVLILMAIMIIGSSIPVWADEHEKESEGEQAQSGEDWQALKQESRRMRINEMADTALETLFNRSIQAQDLYDRSFGWAVFDNWKLAFMLSGGGGNGVAVEKESGNRTFMRMGTGGIGLGLGVQKSQVVFLFATEGTFLNFVENGWQADAGARAAAGRSGVNAKTAFVNGIAVFQMTDKGLMANADIAGTKYWKNKNLNQSQ